MTIGQRIRKLRIANDMTQEQLADLCGVTRTSVTHWELGTTVPRSGALDAMARAFRVPPSAIAYGEEQEGDERMSADEAELLDLYRASTPQWKNNILMTARAAAGQSREEAENSASVKKVG